MVLKLFYASKSMMNEGRMPQRQYALPTSSVGGINSINLSSDESAQRVVIKVNVEYLAKQWLLASTFLYNLWYYLARDRTNNLQGMKKTLHQLSHCDCKPLPKL